MLAHITHISSRPQKERYLWHACFRHWCTHLANCLSVIQPSALSLGLWGCAHYSLSPAGVFCPSTSKPPASLEEDRGLLPTVYWTKRQKNKKARKWCEYPGQWLFSKKTSTYTVSSKSVSSYVNSGYFEYHGRSWSIFPSVLKLWAPVPRCSHHPTYPSVFLVFCFLLLTSKWIHVRS